MQSPVVRSSVSTANGGAHGDYPVNAVDAYTSLPGVVVPYENDDYDDYSQHRDQEAIRYLTSREGLLRYNLLKNKFTHYYHCVGMSIVFTRNAYTRRSTTIVISIITITLPL